MSGVSLRRRFTQNFAVLALVVATLFAGLTYIGVRHIVVTSRQASDLQQAYVNAALVRNAVAEGVAGVPTLLASLDTATLSTSFVRVGSTWFAGSTQASPLSLPDSMKSQSAAHVTRQVVITDGQPVLIVAVPLPSVGATYFQRRELKDVNGTLGRLLNVLFLGAAVTTVVGAFGGRRATRRAVAPLEETASAARMVAGGDLSARLPVSGRDDEVAMLSRAFNEMIELLVERLERDARFAGDVSHELRSPLTTLAMTTELLRAHRSELSPEAQEALDLLAGDVETFQSLVEDLLEMARAEAGGDDLVIEQLPIHELTHQCVMAATRRHHLPSTTVVVSPSALDAHVAVDRRRFERVVTNLLENGYRYGAGTVIVHVDANDDTVIVDVDDNGPGINSEDRERVFERFYRGSSAGARGTQRGTGLGLALVAEHIARFGGTVTIDDAELGGCRVHVTLPRAFEEPA